MKIVKIEKSKHKQERVLVYPEEGSPLRITEAELLQFGVYQGMELSDALAEELQAAGRKSELRAKAAHMASSRMLSKKELAERLTKKGADAEDAESAADWLADLGAVDDAAYAGVIVRHYGAMGYGAGRVRQELQRRGVPRELWDEAMAELPDPAESIRHFIRTKLRNKPLDVAMSKKLSDALLRRGFRWNDIRPILNELGQDIEE